VYLESAYTGLRSLGAQTLELYDGEQVVLTSVTDPRGDYYEYRVPSRQLALTKTWSPETQLPPLSIAAAVIEMMSR
jgi:hypothetical protein